ncbi:hypothetical protein P6F26_16305, partial [Roseibacterium sp. SDUM158017]|nr:hypothetical protein [Roseibacterium sp. SDUM158017]
EALAAAEGRLSEANAAAEAGAGRDVARMAELEETLAARAAELSEAKAAREALDARVADLEAAAAEISGEAGRAEELERENAILKRRVERAREERDAAMEARDAAQDAADELSAASRDDPEPRIAELRAELRRMQAVVDGMSGMMDELRAAAAAGGDAEAVNRGLQAQVAALTEARRSEAAELDRIVTELAAASGQGPAGPADSVEAGHA